MNPFDRRGKLREIHSVASALRADADAQAPTVDLSGAILSRVHAERPFLNRSTRRAIWIGRAGLGASVAVMVLGACLAWRFWPERMDILNQPAPLSAVVDTVGTQASIQFVSLRDTIGPEGQAAATQIVSAMARKAESRVPICCERGPNMPAIEALRRGVVVQPMALTPIRVSAKQLSTSGRFKGPAPAHSIIRAEPRPEMVAMDLPVRAGSLIDEQDLDSGLGPK